MAKRKKFQFKWQWLVWLGLGLGIVLLVGLYSIKTYLISQQRVEPQIAVLGPSHTITFPEEGEVRLYYFDWTVPITIKLSKDGVTKTFNMTRRVPKDTGIMVEAGDSLVEEVIDNIGPGYGWIEPENDKCGIVPAGIIDISDFIDIVDKNNQPIVSVQCWADSDTANESTGPDYDDYVVIITYTGTGEEDEADEDDNGEDSDTGKDTDNQASFVVHKFLDANKNGVRETGEEATNRAWEFEYQINDGEKRTYTVDPSEETGELIYVDKGTRVKVSELGQEGWLNTTGAELTKTLYEAKTYDFYFGNYPVDGSAEQAAAATNFPPTQPETGIPTWITVTAAAAVLGLLAAKLVFKF